MERTNRISVSTPTTPQKDSEGEHEQFDLKKLTRAKSEPDVKGLPKRVKPRSVDAYTQETGFADKLESLIQGVRQVQLHGVLRAYREAFTLDPHGLSHREKIQRLFRLLNQRPFPDGWIRPHLTSRHGNGKIPSYKLRCGYVADYRWDLGDI